METQREAEWRAKEDENCRARAELEPKLAESKQLSEKLAPVLAAEWAKQAEADRKAEEDAKRRQEEQRELEAEQAAQQAASEWARQEEARRKAKEERDRKIAKAQREAKKAKDEAARIEELIAAEKAQEQANQKAQEKATHLLEAQRKAEAEWNTKIDKARQRADEVAATLRAELKLRADLKKEEEEQDRARRKDQEIARKKALLKTVDDDTNAKLSTPDVRSHLSKGIVEMRKPIQFVKGTADLDASGAIVLEQVAGTLRTLAEVSRDHGLPLARFLVAAHTNGPDPKRLSTSRARKLVRLLVDKHQCDGHMVAAKGFGGSRRKYKVDHEDPDMRDVTLNERVEFNLRNAEQLVEKAVERSSPLQITDIEPTDE